MMPSNCVSKLKIYVADITLTRPWKQRNMQSALRMKFSIRNYRPRLCCTLAPCMQRGTQAMMIFVTLLVEGLVYAWAKGALDWK